MKYCFVFVCQPGELEIKSLLLAASLKRHLLEKDYELVAAVPHPTDRWGTLAQDTVSLLQQLGVHTVPIVNRISEDYPIGNKVACLNISTSALITVFLDSDMLCLREFAPDDYLSPPFCAKPADLATFAKDSADWQAVYALFNLPLPKRRIMTTVSGELTLPYFNAGVIAVQTDLHFGQVWETCCQHIDAAESVTNKRPWLDQIALPVALAQLGIGHHCLDERLNYPAHLKPLPDHLPWLCHYHWHTVIRREPRLNQLVSELAIAYPLLRQKLLQVPEWANLLKPYCVKSSNELSTFPLLERVGWKRPKSPVYPQHEPDLIITGIPRSGTSYLGKLLHTSPDCVVINEPRQVFKPLAEELVPWSVALLYQELRRDILDGRAVENKIKNGQLIEDTAIVDEHNFYTPSVSRADFLLGTKNTLAYMARLSQLQRIMPHAPIVACVRHPLDTIASWKTTFAHLRNAVVADFPVGHLHDPLLATWQRHRLAEIAATPEVVLKRALLWRYLAECLLMNQRQLIIVRYEELVERPVETLQMIIRQTPHAPPLYGLDKLAPSRIRSKQVALDTMDRQVIGDICGQYAAELGYNLVYNNHS